MLKDRIRVLVDRYWGGSVYGAARDLGIPQQTLQRIVTGETLNPRVRVLERIAAGCDTTVDWLLTGKGPEPPEADSEGGQLTGSRIRLRSVLDRLGAAGDLRLHLMALAYAPFRAAMLVGVGSAEATSKATEASAEAWANLLDSAIKQSGEKVVRQAFERRELEAALGFTYFGGELSGRREVRKLYAEWTRAGKAEDEQARLKREATLKRKARPR